MSINVFSVDNDITNDEVSFTIELTLHPHEFTGDAEKAYNKLVSYSKKTVAGILITFKYLTTGIIDAIKDAIANDNFKASTTVSSILISVVVVVAFLPVGG